MPRETVERQLPSAARGEPREPKASSAGVTPKSSTTQEATCR
jgi:hypothetical protein